MCALARVCTSSNVFFLGLSEKLVSTLLTKLTHTVGIIFRCSCFVLMKNKIFVVNPYCEENRMKRGVDLRHDHRIIICM